LQVNNNNNSLAQIKQVNDNLQSVYLNQAQQRKINSGQSQKNFNLQQQQNIMIVQDKPVI
jgi:hypothetical protein